MSDKVRVRLDKAGYAKALKPTRFTSQRIADRLDIDKTLLSHYVNGRRDISYSKAIRIADLLGVDISQIIEPDSVRFAWAKPGVCPECRHCREQAVA